MRFSLKTLFVVTLFLLMHIYYTVEGEQYGWGEERYRCIKYKPVHDLFIILDERKPHFKIHRRVYTAESIYWEVIF